MHCHWQEDDQGNASASTQTTQHEEVWLFRQRLTESDGYCHLFENFSVTRGVSSVTAKLPLQIKLGLEGRERTAWYESTTITNGLNITTQYPSPFSWLGESGAALLQRRLGYRHHSKWRAGVRSPSVWRTIRRSRYGRVNRMYTGFTKLISSLGLILEKKLNPVKYQALCTIYAYSSLLGRIVVKAQRESFSGDCNAGHLTSDFGGYLLVPDKLRLCTRVPLYMNHKFV